MIQTLLVDDEPMALANLNYILKSFPSFNVAGTCAVPEDALAFCANHEVDVVFMDIEMPRIKGMELRRPPLNRQVKHKDYFDLLMIA